MGWSCCTPLNSVVFSLRIVNWVEYTKLSYSCVIRVRSCSAVPRFSWAPLAFFPVCVSLFLLSGVVNEKIKGQFEDENAKFRPLPPVPDTGC